MEKFKTFKGQHFNENYLHPNLFEYFIRYESYEQTQYQPSRMIQIATMMKDLYRSIQPNIIYERKTYKSYYRKLILLVLSLRAHYFIPIINHKSRFKNNYLSLWRRNGKSSAKII